VSRTLIRGGCVLTLGHANYAAADVLIDGGLVAEVGTGLKARDAEVIDGAGTIVMPGFVDAHRHVAESLFHNLGEDMSPERFASHYAPDDVYAGTLVGLLGALDAGTTSVVDWCAFGRTPEHLDAACQAHEDSGLRTVLVHGSSGEGDWRAGLAHVAAASGPSLTGAAGPPAPRKGQDGLEDWAAARAAGLRLHVHAGASPDDRGAVALLGERGDLGPDVTLIHCTYLNDADLDAVAASRASVVSTPSSEMVGGFGSPPIQRFMDHGIRPGLGVETGRRGSPIDMFAQMRALISLQHATHFDLKLAGKAGLPKLLNTREVIRYATVDGARAAGLAAGLGVLEPGSAADLIVLRADRPNIHPINDAIGAVVWGMDTSNVEWVFVAGKARKRNGEITADIDRARSLAVAASERVGAAVAVPAARGGG
jgi:cytosine/adenosine deaminase-related metal-dependent hydrolase